jgi:two-component system LytT family response regulator
MTAIIVDDEIQSHQVLNHLLAKAHADIQIIASGYNVQEGLELIQKHRPELVFLDVEMPDGQGFDLLKKIASPNFNVIFITAHQHYAVTAFRFGALDFLLKPVNEEELIVALERARNRKKEHLSIEQINIFWDALDKLKEQKLPTRISIATQEGIIFKQVTDIIRLEAKQNYTEFIVASDSKKILASTNIGEFEEQFKPYQEFMRVHRSHLVNLLCVDKYIRAEGGYLLLRNADKIGVSRNYRDELQERLQKL